MKNLYAWISIACASAFAVAQSPEHNHSHKHEHAAASTPQTPYAGEQQRNIKALSAQEQNAWLEGQGMGLAKSAELNGYPGPMHTLEHASALKLTASQLASSQALMLQHKTTVKLLGAQLVEMERHLDQAFSTRSIDAASIDRMTAHIASLQGKIRAEHLKTHLLQTNLLTAEQIKQYNALRGYGQ
jgi:Spy/CpxP family protein refolding chaperone